FFKQKTAYEMDTADIYCGTDPNVVLARLLREELEASGFRVLIDADDADPSALRVVGSVRQFFIEPVVTFFTYTPAADIEVRLVVTTPAGLRAVRRFYVKGHELSFFGTDDNFQYAYDKAVRQRVR